MKFWENKDWIEKMKKHDPDFLKVIEKAKSIEIIFDPFSLIVDGVKFPLGIFDSKGNQGEITYKK